MRPGWILAAVAVACTVAMYLVGAWLVASAAGRADAMLYGDKFHSVKLHAMQSGLAMVLMGAVAWLPASLLRRIAPVGLLAGLGFAWLTIGSPFGVRSGGATREVVLGPIRWEPGQMLVLAIVLWAAAMLARRPLGLRRRAMAVTVVLVALGVAFLQPDFSLIPLMLVPIGMQAWRARLHGRQALPLALGLGLLIVVAAAFHPYVTRRVAGWMRPQQTARYEGRDYVLLRQAMKAGGLWGAGYGRGRYVIQTGAAKSDYFFGHAVEELGLVRAWLLLLLYVPIFGLGAWVSERARDRFVALLGTGMAAYILTAVLIHVAVSLRIIPVTAIHLPFFSFGGSSLVTSTLALGFLLVANRAITHNSPMGPSEDTSPACVRT